MKHANKRSKNKTFIECIYSQIFNASTATFIMEIDGNTSKNCVICKFTGGTNETINGVNAYIIDSIGSVDLNEIVKQVTEAMVASDIHITEARGHR